MRKLDQPEAQRFKKKSGFHTEAIKFKDMALLREFVFKDDRNHAEVHNGVNLAPNGLLLDSQGLKVIKQSPEAPLWRSFLVCWAKHSLQGGDGLHSFCVVAAHRTLVHKRVCQMRIAIPEVICVVLVGAKSGETLAVHPDPEGIHRGHKHVPELEGIQRLQTNEKSKKTSW